MRRGKIRRRVRNLLPKTKREEAGAITNTLRNQVYKADGYTCVYCGAEAQLSVDHVIPVVQGGVTSFENSVTACRSCNSRKGGKTPNEAKMHPQWGRYFKPAPERRALLQKWFGKYRGWPETKALMEGREAGLSIVELAYAYSSYRNWSVEHAMQYLMQEYGRDLWSRK
jgi:5-methylcytosine-specific restriction endonuclease McrA